MKKFITLIGLLLYSLTVLSDTPPPLISVKDSGDSNYITTVKFNFPNFTGTHTGTQFSLGVNSVIGGGTGLSSLTQNGLLLGNGSNNPTFLVGGSTGNVVTWNGSTWVSSAVPTSGTVTSVALALPNIFSVSGSPITSSGTLTGTLANQNANTFWAGPSSGSAIPPTFRTIQSADLPAGLGTVSSVSVASANGFSGTVANATTTPAITLSTSITGLIQGSSGSLASYIGGSLVESGSSVLTIGNGANAVIGTGTTLQVKQSSTSQSGYLSSTDWNTFNGKEAAGNYITALTGDGTASGPGSSAFTLASVATPGTSPKVTFNAKGLVTSGTTLSSGDIPNNAANTSGTAANITATSNSSLTTLSSLSLPYSQVTGGPSANAITALTGDITASGPGSAAATLATVNTNTGSFGSSTSIPSFTVNGKGLITAASGNVVIAPAGTLSGTTLNSTVVTSSLTSLGTQSAVLNLGSHLINAVTDPVSAQDAATKNYVDTSIAALNPAEATYAATTANLTGTYLNGVSGVGATFTITATGAFTLDGTTPPVNSRILIKNQSSGFQNGVYNLTVAGTTGVSPILTRSSDYNTASDMNSAGLIPVINGTVNALSSWQQIATITTVGTDSLVFTEFTANPSLYLLKANNLSDVASASTAFSNIDQLATNSIAGSVSTTTQTFGGNKTLIGTLALTPGGSTGAFSIDSPSFIFDSTNNALGIGVQPSSTSTIDAINSNGSSKAIQVTSYGTGSTIPFRGRFARGTSGSPAAAQNGDSLAVFSGRGYGASQFAAASTGAINAVAGETFTNTSNATYLSFLVTPTASVTSAEAARINSTGNVLIGTTTDSGTQKLQVNGNSNVGTVTSGVWNGTATSGQSFLISGVTYTTPANITTATVFEITLVGGGAAGGGTPATVNTKGAGGGAGATCVIFLTGLNPSTAYTIAIGGNGSGSSNATGGNGGNTTISINAVTYTAGGGSGGPAGVTTNGGVGGTCTNASIAVSGQNGGGTATAAGNQTVAGIGGSSLWGLGGNGIQGTAAGNAGTGFGAAGQGSTSTVATAEAGGPGTPGMILIKWKN